MRYARQNCDRSNSSYSWSTTAKCRQASGLKEANPVSKIILFGDDVGYDDLMIKGRYPQPHMKNKATQVLCLFNRKTRKAYIGEME